MNNLVVNNNLIPYYGGHMSITKGIVSAISDINEIGGNMIQIFISSPMMLNSKIDMKKYSSNIVEQIKNKCIETNSKIVIHLPYVINLAKPLDYENPLETKWIKIIVEQLNVSDLIGSLGCVIHVGKYTGQTEAEGLDNMFKALKLIINYIINNNLNTYIILETAAGQGTELIPTKNNSLSSFGDFYNKFTNEEKQHIKICVDTCHIFAAGYDIREKLMVKTFFDQFNEIIGLENLALIHLNDSKKTCGSCVDRHENLGEGCIGLEGLRHFIRYAIYYKIPIVLETPSDYINELKLINKVNLGVKKWIEKNG
jgi:deoxyribonuclease-4